MAGLQFFQCLAGGIVKDVVHVKAGTIYRLQRTAGVQGFHGFLFDGHFNFLVPIPLLLCALGTGILTKLCNSGLGGEAFTAVLTSFLKTNVSAHFVARCCCM